jgi:hypothetical protein
LEIDIDDVDGLVVAERVEDEFQQLPNLCRSLLTFDYGLVAPSRFGLPASRLRRASPRSRVPRSPRRGASVP